MQFKYPELLYALFVLIIPILVHLFQLQRYTKVPFTNVQLLKNIQKETRKSARLKKWLVLLTRMLALACLIIAFAQPFTSEYNPDEIVHTSIYLDNSLSMKAKGSKGELMRAQVNALIENNSYENEHIDFYSNFNSFKYTSKAQLKEALIALNYQAYPVNFESELLRIKNENSNARKNRFVILSDFQEYQFLDVLNSIDTETVLLKLAPIRPDNTFIDSVYTSDFSATNISINAVIKSRTATNDPISVTLFNGPTIYGKSTVQLNNNSGIATFSIPTDATFLGKLSIEDQSLDFDNDFYFTYAIPETVDILSIGNNSPYLKKIFDYDTFNYENSSNSQVNYATLNTKQFVILNELKSFSDALIAQLQEYQANGGHLLIIPASNSDVNSYNKLLRALKIGSISSKQNNTLQITGINFDHPIFNKVFDRSVENFQYPASNAHYLPNFNASSTILSFQNNSSFITATKKNNGQVYYVSSALSTSETNFKESPLIVPVFYNMAAQSNGEQDIHYFLGAQTSVDVHTSISQDQVLSIKNEELDFIPIQQVFKNRVQLELGDQLQKSGFYEVLKGEEFIKHIALNYSRKESNLSYIPVENLTNKPHISIANSLESLLSEINASYKINSLFKWFLAFSVLFLFFEMLILKYFKL